MNKAVWTVILFIVLGISPCERYAHGSVALPKTGQTECHDSFGTSIGCADTGQDGEIRAGVAWPDPRFIDNIDGTITDALTNLIWTKNANAPGPVACGPGVEKTWAQALAYVACLNADNYLNHNDWRLPNLLELESLVNAGEDDSSLWLASQGFQNVQKHDYWSSTTVAATTDNAWLVSVWIGHFNKSNYNNKNIYSGNYVWPVRSGQTADAPAQLHKSGQTACYDDLGAVISCQDSRFPGQDGAVKAGATWPEPRFNDNPNGTVTDNLTGLVWTKDAGEPVPAGCSSATKRTWAQALAYVVCLNANSYLGFQDWRLPNRKELLSLADFSTYKSALKAGHPFVNFFPSYAYWTSDTNESLTGTAWYVSIWDGQMMSDNKNPTYNYHAWAVRGGAIADPVSLTILKSGSGMGAVLLTPPGSLQSGFPLTAYYEKDSVVTIQAVSDPGQEFTGWTGCPSPAGDTCTVTMGSDISVTVSFKNNLIFSDVLPDYWAYSYIDSFSERGITAGCVADNPNTSQNEAMYCPDRSVTRAQMAVFLTKALGQQPAAACTGMVFNDVNASMVGGTAFCRYIEKFRELNITAGCGNNNYCPDASVTRAQMAVFLTKALGELAASTCSQTVFLDVNAAMNGGTGFCRYIEKFKELDITAGCGNGNYCPDNVVTRAQMAVFLIKGFFTPVVTLSPDNSSVFPGESLKFIATVKKSVDKNVTWSTVNGCGSIDASGLFTAPGYGTTCQVVATSTLDPTKSGSAGVNVYAFMVQPTTIGPSGGTVNGGVITLTIPGGTIPAGTQLDLSPGTPDERFSGFATSSTYTLSGLPDTLGGVIHVEVAGSPNSPVVLVIGEDVFSASGGTMAKGYRYFPLTWNGSKWAGDIPASDLGQALTLSATAVSAGQAPTTETVSLLSISGSYSRLSAQGHFRINYPVHLLGLQPDPVDALAQNLEAAYATFQNMGFSYAARTSWPMDVSFVNLAAGTYGYFSPSWAWGVNGGALEFNYNEIGNPGELRVTAGHEFMHFVQSLYDPRNRYSAAKFESRHYWLDEATAVWAEQFFTTTAGYRSAVLNYSNAIAPFLGMTGSGGALSGQQHGYGMSALIKWLAGKAGNAIVFQIYGSIKANKHPIDAVVTAYSDPTVLWWSSFIRDYFEGMVYPGYPGAGVLISLLPASNQTFSASGFGTVYNPGAHLFGLQLIQGKNLVDYFTDMSARLYLIRSNADVAPLLEASAGMNFAPNPNAGPDMTFMVYRRNGANVQYLATPLNGPYVAANYLQTDQYVVLATFSRNVAPYDANSFSDICTTELQRASIDDILQGLSVGFDFSFKPTTQGPNVQLATIGVPVSMTGAAFSESIVETDEPYALDYCMYQDRTGTMTYERTVEGQFDAARRSLTTVHSRTYIKFYQPRIQGDGSIICDTIERRAEVTLTGIPVNIYTGIHDAYPYSGGTLDLDQIEYDGYSLSVGQISGLYYYDKNLSTGVTNYDYSTVDFSDLSRQPWSRVIFNAWGVNSY